MEGQEGIYYLKTKIQCRREDPFSLGESPLIPRRARQVKVSATLQSSGGQSVHPGGLGLEGRGLVRSPAAILCTWKDSNSTELECLIIRFIVKTVF